MGELVAVDADDLRRVVYDGWAQAGVRDATARLRDALNKQTERIDAIRRPARWEDKELLSSQDLEEWFGPDWDLLLPPVMRFETVDGKGLYRPEPILRRLAKLVAEVDWNERARKNWREDT